MSDLNAQLNKYLNIFYAKIIEILNLFAFMYKSTISNFEFYINEINILIPQLSRFIISMYRVIIERINLEFNDLKLIYISFINSLSPNGRIASIFILGLILFFILYLTFSSNNKKPTSEKKKTKIKSIKSQLLEIEIDLLELQDKYKRRIISLNSYLAETKRLEEKASKIN